MSNVGLIHSKAAKKRDKAEAKLLDEQRKALQAAAPHPDAWYREPTLGGLLSRRNRKDEGGRNDGGGG
jgi:hypothetical protein